MEPRQIWANFSVADINRTTDFYTKLGFKPNGKPSDEITSFLFGDADFGIHFFTKERFTNAINGDFEDVPNGSEIIFSLSAKSRDEVDQWFEKVKTIGAKIYAEPQNFDKGYTFGFCDPDGHKFNFLYWPKN